MITVTLKGGPCAGDYEIPEPSWWPAGKLVIPGIGIYRYESRTVYVFDGGAK